MSDSMTLSRNVLPPAFQGGAALRWSLSITVALAVECAIVLLAWPVSHAPEPVPEPVKVMKLVTIAEVPPLPAPPARPVPTTPKPVPPKPSPKPLPKEAPVPLAKSELVPLAPVPVAESAPQPAYPVAARPAALSAPVPPKAEPGEVRRGLVPLLRVEPDYPPKALARNAEGVVVAHVTIEKDGSVSAVQIVRAQPAKLFDQAATKALMQWKFSRTHEPVLGEVELRFSLN